MKWYVKTCVTALEHLLRTPPTDTKTVVLTTEGIYEIRQNKIYRCSSTNVPVYEDIVDGVRVLCDESVVTYHEVWQVPMPHHLDEVTRYTFDLGDATFVLEQGDHQSTYFSRKVDAAWFKSNGCNCAEDCRYCRL